MIKKMIRNDPSNNAVKRYPPVVTKIARMGFWLTIIFALYMSASSAHACDFRKSFFGDSKEKIAIADALLFPDQWGGESLAIPMEALCETDDSLYGTTVIYLYIDDELSQIRLERPLMNDKKLMDYAMRKYGSFNLPTTVDKLAWRGNYYWESGNERIEYIAIDIDGGETEIIAITNRLYEQKVFDYNSKIGKWLDGQQ
jgi:hypothetical protein